MAKIEKSKGRKGGGYERLFGNEDLGHLISRVQAAVISSGTELERIIKREVDLIDDLDKFLEQEIMQEGVLLAEKRQLKNSKKLGSTVAEPDFVVFRRREGRQRCHVIELKDGDNFDTKKSAAEQIALHTFISQNAQFLPFTVSAHICCFNQTSKDEVVKAFKNKVPRKEALTGAEFCDLLEIDYQKIIQERKQNQRENLEYFVKELVQIHSVRDIIEGQMRTEGKVG